MNTMLKLLENNARITMEELASAMGITAAEAAQQLDDLKRRGIIHGFCTVIDWDKVQEDRVSAIIELRVSPQKNTGFDDIANSIVGFPEVDSVYLVSGGYDLSVIVHGKSFKDIAFFVSERLAPIDNVLSTATHFILRRYKEDGVCFTEGEGDERSEFLL